MLDVVDMDYLNWIPERIAALRLAKGVSARELSLSLGQSESYINKIENRRTLPSLQGLLYICTYFGITPAAFFDVGDPAPDQIAALTEAAGRLNPEQRELLLQLAESLLG